jgi:peroxiredoxin
MAPIVGVAVLGIAYLASRPLGGSPRPSFFVIASAAPGVQIGQIAPGTATADDGQLSLSDLDGTPLRLADFADRPLWLVFWKTACEPCEAEAADVTAAYAAHRNEGLAVLAVDVWDTPDVVRDYTASHPLDYPIAIDTSGSFLAAYGVWGAPTHYFIGSDGIIRDRYFGPMTADLIAGSLATIVQTEAP